MMSLGKKNHTYIENFSFQQGCFVHAFLETIFELSTLFVFSGSRVDQTKIMTYPRRIA